MSLAKKLARLSSAGPEKKPTAPPVAATEQNVAREVSPRTEVDARPPFSAVQTPHGPVNLRETFFPSHHHHGRAPTRAALEADGATVSALALDPALNAFDPRGMLLLDTETTGLAGGTGTLPFVVGIGEFEGDVLRVRQLVLRRPGEEAPILRLLAERISAASCLVTYNGKTFDWPLLKNRFVMNRLPIPKAPLHLDLLHCARRVFKHREGGAKLTHLEEQVLGHQRVDDIPGAQIPELYFRYLKVQDDALITPVLEHNAHDMVLLAALLGHMVREYREQLAQDPRDLLGYATVAYRAEDEERAITFARRATTAANPDVQCRALTLAATLHRRRGQVHEALKLLERAVHLASGSELAEIHLALAKLYEHRLRDAAKAAEHAKRAAAAETHEDHRARVARLNQKLTPNESAPTLMLPLDLR